MKNYFKKISLVLFSLALALVSCTSEIDSLEPINQDTPNNVFDNPDSYRSFLAKIYAGIALSGQDGPAGNPDIAGLDEGFSNYLRLYWNMQELTTDEAIIGWNDGTIKDLHYQNWTDGNEFIRTMFDRVMYQVSLCNEYLRQTTDAKLDERGVSGDLRTDIGYYRAEARFMRALSYYHALDMFQNVPFVTEDDPIGAFFPEQTNGVDLFNYLVQELTDIDPLLKGPGQNEYGRADQAAAWMLLAKLYLNSEIYLGQGQDQIANALTPIENIINSNQYQLEDDYTHLFLADNNFSNEIIFPITFDGLNTQGFGGMTYLLHAPVGGNMEPSDFGINGGWAGIRTTSTFVELFPGMENSQDGRELFFTDGQTLEITDVSDFTNGYAIAKFKNIDQDGEAGSDSTGDFPDTDFPMFRLADAYLMYAELYARNVPGANENDAIMYINLLRERAYGNASANISSGSEITYDFILDERGRELYWECHRRTDLIRFGKFSDSGVWPWKGNVPTGVTTESFRDLFPLPSTAISSNPTLEQNNGY